MTDNSRRTGPAVEAHFQFLMWLVPAVEKFPRTQKFLLGDRIQTTALDVLECLIEATYTRDRKKSGPQRARRRSVSNELPRHALTSVA
jgi:hypothetical protein